MYRAFKIAVPMAASLLLSVSAASAATQAQPSLTTLQQVVALNNEQAAQKIPVHLQATVTHSRASSNSLFLTDKGFNLFVAFGDIRQLQPGDRVDVTGATAGSFRPIIAATQVRFLAHGSLPAPKPARFEDLIQAKLDCHYVELRGHVLSADFDLTEESPSLRIRLQIPDGIVEGVLRYSKDMPVEKLLDADVRLTGVVAGDFDSKMQMAGITININSWQDIEILHLAKVDPWTLPATPMDQVVSSYRTLMQSRRVRLTGTLTYFEPGVLAVIEHQGQAMMLETHTGIPLHTGQGVEALGYPEITGGTVRLVNAQIRPFAETAPVQPAAIDWEKASTGKFANNLITIEGQIVAMVPDPSVDLFVIQSDGHLFSASMNHASSDSDLKAEGARWPSVGSRVRVTGVCFVAAGNHWKDRLWFDLHLRSMADLAVETAPSWWTTKRLATVITLLSALILAAVIWVGLLDRRLREQTRTAARQSQEDAMRERQMARQEQQRSHILELISSAQPLPEVLQEIQSMVSSRLYGASCWFELKAHATDEAPLKRPLGPAIVFEELFSPDGLSLGFLLATPHLQTAGRQDIATALKAGARLAELAIDTRRLYSDLRHRSEYDLLTDIPNRFSMERRLDELMENARRTGAIFGLVYVDFDRFKQVNDKYGHRAGDLYLQEGTRRMKAQLRNGDMLARIGGDEFVALVPILRSRADAEEIAVRLERCFDDPFEIDGITLLGSASVGLAVYPEDGSTEEELQRSADAAMYAHKEGKRHQDKLEEAMRRLLSKD